MLLILLSYYPSPLLFLFSFLNSYPFFASSSPHRRCGLRLWAIRYFQTVQSSSQHLEKLFREWMIQCHLGNIATRSSNVHLSWKYSLMFILVCFPHFPIPPFFPPFLPCILSSGEKSHSITLYYILLTFLLYIFITCARHHVKVTQTENY